MMDFGGQTEPPLLTVLSREPLHGGVISKEQNNFNLEITCTRLRNLSIEACPSLHEFERAVFRRGRKVLIGSNDGVPVGGKYALESVIAPVNRIPRVHVHGVATAGVASKGRSGRGEVGGAGHKIVIGQRVSKRGRLRKLIRVGATIGTFNYTGLRAMRK